MDHQKFIKKQLVANFVGFNRKPLFVPVVGLNNTLNDSLYPTPAARTFSLRPRIFSLTDEDRKRMQGLDNNNSFFHFTTKSDGGIVMHHKTT